MIDQKVRYHIHVAEYHVIFFGANALKFIALYVIATSTFLQVVFFAFSFTNHKHISRILCPSSGTSTEKKHTIRLTLTPLRPLRHKPNHTTNQLIITSCHNSFRLSTLYFRLLLRSLKIALYIAAYLAHIVKVSHLHTHKKYSHYAGGYTQ